MELTKKQRHKCYKEALKNFNVAPIFLCHLLREALADFGYIPAQFKPSDYPFTMIPDVFPELKAIGEEIGVDTSICRPWWYRDDIANRRQALERCIRETAEEETTWQKILQWIGREIGVRA